MTPHQYLAALMLSAIVGCGSKGNGEPLPPQPSHIWEPGLYKIEAFDHTIHIGIDGSEVTLAGTPCFSEWRYFGVWYLIGNCKLSIGRVEFEIHEKNRIILYFNDRTLVRTAVLVTGNN